MKGTPFRKNLKINRNRLRKALNECSREGVLACTPAEGAIKYAAGPDGALCVDVVYQLSRRPVGCGRGATPLRIPGGLTKAEMKRVIIVTGKFACS